MGVRYVSDGVDVDVGVMGLAMINDEYEVLVWSVIFTVEIGEEL